MRRLHVAPLTDNRREQGVRQLIGSKERKTGIEPATPAVEAGIRLNSPYLAPMALIPKDRNHGVFKNPLRILINGAEMEPEIFAALQRGRFTFDGISERR